MPDVNLRRSPNGEDPATVLEGAYIGEESQSVRLEPSSGHLELAHVRRWTTRMLAGRLGHKRGSAFVKPG